MKKYYCPDCSEVFEELGSKDDGIGSYEFWGQRCTQVEMVNCCPKCGSDEYVEVEEGVKCNFCGNIDDVGEDFCSLCRRFLDEGTEVIFADGEVWEVE
jgi:hypothetical protein